MKRRRKRRTRRRALPWFDERTPGNHARRHAAVFHVLGVVVIGKNIPVADERNGGVVGAFPWVVIATRPRYTTGNRSKMRE